MQSLLLHNIVFANCFVLKLTVTRLKCMERLGYFLLNNVSEQTTDLHVIWDAMMLTWRFYVMTSSNLHTIIRIYDFVTYKQIDGASKLRIWCIHFILAITVTSHERNSV